MAERFEYLGEPSLVFGHGQRAEDPRDGLALFGALDAEIGLPHHVVIGTPSGVALWNRWVGRDERSRGMRRRAPAKTMAALSRIRCRVRCLVAGAGKGVHDGRREAQEGCVSCGRL